ncbi:uncharacterized protein LOC121727889 [Aricia agestis]|uniref:uncharacterized protein LOC121727889 n=1 Tax=Aricia agestis TaxID=91739 RepID=UPI001C2080EA|nr:uncharacterized protein LOC121727889 [Aricia agestis]
MMTGAWGVAGGFAAAEVCAPLLVLCWLCCWPADDSSDTSSGNHPQKPAVVTHEVGSRKKSHDWTSKRFGSSAVSLHLPSTSGTKQPLSAHRSHEEIRGRRKSHHEVVDDTRYHSAPSVIDEVLHRRDWERSNKDLYIPLKSSNNSEANSSNEEEEATNPNELTVERTCKKHYTNIKSSKNKNSNKELLNEDIKDSDATEVRESPSFYIGEATDISNEINDTSEVKDNEIFKPKVSKQNLNESIKSADVKKQSMPEFQITGTEETGTVDGKEIDRSGAVHHTVESRSSLYNVHPVPIPPPSVEAVGYDSDASYLAEDDVLGAWRLDREPGVMVERVWGRARHGSAGDVLAPTMRPHSAALSESDLDYELEECDEAPPSYDQLHLLSTRERKETAI